MFNIQMEVTNHCNLKCVECPNRLMKRKREYMNKQVYNTLIERYIKKYPPDTIILSKDGEPLLHPNLPDILQSISNVSNAKFDLYTNGAYFTEQFCEFLGTLRNKVSVLMSFHRHNWDGKVNDYRDVWVEVERCVRKKIKNITFIVVTHITDLTSREEAEEWMRPWRKLQKECPNLAAVHVNPDINPWTGRVKQKHMVHFKACPYGDAQHMFVGVTGNVLPCCMDLEEEVVLGNIFIEGDERIMEIRKVFYETLRKGEVAEELCRRCLSA